MDFKIHAIKDKLIVSFILLFSVLFDALLSFFLNAEAIGLTLPLLVIAIIFLLQHHYKIVRKGLLLLILALIAYRFFDNLLNGQIAPWHFITTLIKPATIPLYVTLILFGAIFTRYMRKNSIFSKPTGITRDDALMDSSV